MFPPPEAEQIVPAAVQAAWLELKGTASLPESEAKKKLADRLTYIARRYMKKREYRRTRPRPQTYRRAFERVSGNAGRLLKALEAMPADARGQLARAIRRTGTLPQNGSMSSAAPITLEIVAQAIGDLGRYSSEFAAEAKSSKTNPGHTDLHYVVGALKQLWAEMTNDIWTTNYESHPEDRKRSTFANL